jgi:hypothetical protein
VHDEIAGIDPPAYRASGDVETFRDIGDREQFDLIVAVTATTGMAESGRFLINIAGGLSSRAHAGPRSRGGQHFITNTPGDSSRLPLGLSSSALRIERLDVWSSCAGQRAVHPPPALRPPTALAMVSAVISGLAARRFFVRLLSEFHLDCRKPLDPRSQIIRKHKRAATALDSSQLTRLDRLIERRPAGARDGAGLRDRVGQR